MLRAAAKAGSPVGAGGEEGHGYRHAGVRRHHHRAGQGTAQAAGLRRRVPVRRGSAHHPAGRGDARREGGDRLRAGDRRAGRGNHRPHERAPRAPGLRPHLPREVQPAQGRGQGRRHRRAAGAARRRPRGDGEEAAGRLPGADAAPGGVLRALGGRRRARRAEVPEDFRAGARRGHPQYGRLPPWPDKIRPLFRGNSHVRWHHLRARVRRDRNSVRRSLDPVDPRAARGQRAHARDRRRDQRRRARLPQPPVHDHRHGRPGAHGPDRDLPRRLYRGRLRHRRGALGRDRLHRHERLGARQRAHRGSRAHRPERGAQRRVPRRRHHRHAGGGPRAARASPATSRSCTPTRTTRTTSRTSSTR